MTGKEEEEGGQHAAVGQGLDSNPGLFLERMLCQSSYQCSPETQSSTGRAHLATVGSLDWKLTA